MNKHFIIGASVLLVIWLCFANIDPGRAQTQPPVSTPNDKQSKLSGHATGAFEVKLTPQPADDKTGDATIARMSAEKQFHGDLEGTSKGQMLSSGNPQSSAAYVALEKVTGTLKGRSGSFVLQHTGIMMRGTPQLTITVVPDSGTGQLVGLTGKMNIIITNGKHSYEFDYELPK